MNFILRLIKNTIPCLKNFIHIEYEIKFHFNYTCIKCVFENVYYNKYVFLIGICEMHEESKSYIS